MRGVRWRADADGIATTAKPGFILGEDRNVYGIWLRLLFQGAEYAERKDEGYCQDGAGA